MERRIQSATKAYGALQNTLWSCHDSTKNQCEGLLSCSHSLPAPFHRVHHWQTHHDSNKTPASPPTLHPQHQVARPYARRWGTAPCSHSQCWSPYNHVDHSFAGQDMYVGWPIAGCQKLCSMFKSKRSHGLPKLRFKDVSEMAYVENRHLAWYLGGGGSPESQTARTVEEGHVSCKRAAPERISACACPRIVARVF